jgi:hypothetical protein
MARIAEKDIGKITAKGSSMNLNDIQANIEAIGQLIVALGSLGLFGKIWQGVGLLKTIELDVRNIRSDLSTMDTKMTGVEAFMHSTRIDREKIQLHLDNHKERIAALESERNERRLTTLEGREG